jgi:sigma-B regulation protein RsbU (phosphoserine phosphatase)
MLPGMQFSQETVVIHPGDTVVLYTDGIVEAMNAKEELYGYERFEALLQRSTSEPGGLKETIIADVNRFTGLSAQHDDMTLVCFGAVK